MTTNILIVIWLHFFSDFILQWDYMSRQKSKSSAWLGLHILIYSIPMLWFGWKFALVNGLAHFVTDWFSSRATSKLYSMGQIHWFFVVIGLDQAIHLTTLIWTLDWLT